jgi:hypothetical protein
VNFVPLTPNLATHPWQEMKRSKRAELLGEIAERIIEWAEIEGRPKVHRWLLRVAVMAGDPESTEAVWLYLRLSTGDLAELTTSFSELGKKRNRTKQAEQQETERAMLVVARHFPELKEALLQLKKIK